MSRRPRLLDLFCCQGGAAAGYVAAGFDVVGVDIDPQPRYPYAFVQGDAIHYLRTYGAEFDVIHASPPCQGYSLAQKIQKRDHPLLVDSTRELLREIGRPYVIENVPGAPLVNPIELCGTMFGLRTYRHRLFEASFGVVEPFHFPHVQQTVKMGRPIVDGDFYHAVGNFSNVDYVRRDLRVPWMNRDGVRECIPPVYAAHVGLAALKTISRTGR